MKKCVLCGRNSDEVESFEVTPEARGFIEKQFPGADHDEYLAKSGICKECKSLPLDRRKELADIVTRETLAEARQYFVENRANRFRIDVTKTIEQVSFAPEVVSWINLLGDVLILTQEQAMLRDDAGFLADTPFKELLVRAINRDISSINAIYMLLRCEWIHQAAAHVRLLCESIITLRYIAKDPGIRVPQFLGYEHVEVYEIAKMMLEHERNRAKSVHVRQMEAFLASLQSEYDHAKPQYVVRKKKLRNFSNWCNTSIPQQAQMCGPDPVRLYDIVYRQLSAYVHGSAWSLRRQLAYSRKHYDARAVLVDISTVVRTTLVVWEQWARFCDEQLGWALSESLPEIFLRLEELGLQLDDEYVPK